MTYVGYHRTVEGGCDASLVDARLLRTDVRRDVLLQQSNGLLDALRFLTVCLGDDELQAMVGQDVRVGVDLVRSERDRAGYRLTLVRVEGRVRPLLRPGQIAETENLLCGVDDVADAADNRRVGVDRSCRYCR